jgi:hypothetical protein
LQTGPLTDYPMAANHHRSIISTTGQVSGQVRSGPGSVLAPASQIAGLAMAALQGQGQGQARAGLNWRSGVRGRRVRARLRVRVRVTSGLRADPSRVPASESQDARRACSVAAVQCVAFGGVNWWIDSQTIMGLRCAAYREMSIHTVYNATLPTGSTNDTHQQHSPTAPNAALCTVLVGWLATLCSPEVVIEPIP